METKEELQAQEQALTAQLAKAEKEYARLENNTLGSHARKLLGNRENQLTDNYNIDAEGAKAPEIAEIERQLAIVQEKLSHFSE